MRTFKSFRIKLPSGERYWTVIDGSYRAAQGVDDWLLHLRTGRGCAESTTESYAGALALFFDWCSSIGRDWLTTAGEFGRFVYWLQHYDPDSAPGAVPPIVHGPRRVNVVLAAVREYFRHAAALGEVDDSVDFARSWRGPEPAGTSANPCQPLPPLAIAPAIQS
jgi:integrase/recombinase XerD